MISISQNIPLPWQNLHPPVKEWFYQGNPALLNQPSLAIVGSRRCSAEGRTLAYEWAKSLSLAGLVIVSGLALGIDAAAHQGALDGSGQTIAILGSGLNHIYPQQNLALARTITTQGLILSEYPADSAPHAWHFPMRNRLIASLALGCLVVEASLSSGSMITAKLAIEQGREVFAIPNSIHSTLSKGCHHLIKEGAILVENINDILDEIRFP